MRLWHYKLLPYLDDFHIVAQWRELLAIKGAIVKNGTPNHRLVNKVLDYSMLDFKVYTGEVISELERRKIAFQGAKIDEIMDWHSDKFKPSDNKALYEGWHNNRYLIQCYYNLEEKYDCGIVSEKAFNQIKNFVKEEFEEWLQ